MEESEAHLDAPPKNHLCLFLSMSFGRPKDVSWGTPLYAGELVNANKVHVTRKGKILETVEDDYYGPPEVTDEVEAQD